MAGEAEEEQKKLRAMLEENGEVSSKRLFAFLSLLCIGGIFAVLLVALAQNANVKLGSESFDFADKLAHK